MSACPRRPGPAVLLILALLVALVVALPALVAAQEQTPVPGTNTALVGETTVDLVAGELTWVGVHRASLSDDDPPIPGRDGLLYALDAPLLVLHEGESRFERTPAGEAVALEAGGAVRPVAAQAGPASLLAVGLDAPPAPAATPDPADPWGRVGEPFTATAGEHTLALWRYELTTRPGRTLQQIGQQIAALPYPAVLYVEAGEVIGTPVGQDAPVAVTEHQLIAADAGSALTVSDDGAVVLLATLAPAATTASGGTTSQGAAITRPDAGTPTPGAGGTTTPTTSPTAATAPTVTPTAAPVDTDGDGLSDADEASRGSNPNSRDTDGDGVDDAYEVDLGLDPTKPDTDGDGLGDADEAQDIEQARQQGGGDADGDGLTDGYEGQVSLTNPGDADSDDDGLTDGQEVNAYRSDPLAADTDGDGLTDGADVGAGGSPTNRDTDGDGLSDGFEVNQGTAPNNADTDGDGVDDGYETGRGMNPKAGDSDGDGLGDGAEVGTYGSNPTNPDSDGDGRSDGYEVDCGQDPNTYTDYTDVVACG